MALQSLPQDNISCFSHLRLTFFPPAFDLPLNFFHLNFRMRRIELRACKCWANSRSLSYILKPSFSPICVHVHVCTHVCACVCACCVSGHASEGRRGACDCRLRLASGVSSHYSSPLSTEAGPLTRTQSFQLRVVSLGTLLRASPISAF